MDHHCAWTYNCVGHENMGYFMRFLFWVVLNTGVVAVELTKRLLEFYQDRNLPAYLFDRKELVAVLVLLPLDIFVFFSINILVVRCIMNWVFKGMTQIETWELERIDSQLHTERIWLQIRKNYFKLHGKNMPKLTSWNQSARVYDEAENDQDDDLVVPKDFTIDDLIFPYDLGIWRNIIDTFNYPWMWLLPWNKSSLNGYHFEKNEFAEDDELGLPWPPDGGNQEFEPEPEVDLDNLNSIELRNIRQLRKRMDPRARLDRRDWMNDLGETLDDFGVDLDAEDVENDDLLSK